MACPSVSGQGSTGRVGLVWVFQFQTPTTLWLNAILSDFQVMTEPTLSRVSSVPIQSLPGSGDMTSISHLATGMAGGP